MADSHKLPAIVPNATRHAFYDSIDPASRTARVMPAFPQGGAGLGLPTVP